MYSQNSFLSAENQEALKCLAEKYRLDEKIMKNSFKILIAYETWPPVRFINELGFSIYIENAQLKRALQMLEMELNEYVFANYSMLSLQSITGYLSNN